MAKTPRKTKALPSEKAANDRGTGIKSIHILVLIGLLALLQVVYMHRHTSKESGKTSMLNGAPEAAPFWTHVQKVRCCCCCSRHRWCRFRAAQLLLPPPPLPLISTPARPRSRRPA